METLIKPAGVREAEIIAELSRRTFFDTFAEFNTRSDMDKYMSGPFKKENLMNEVAAHGNIFLLAWVGDQPAGYAKLRTEKRRPDLPNESAIEIARLYADQKWIGKGIGNKLMQACIETATDMRKTTIWLGVWENNPRAIRFYERWGF